MLGSLGPFFLGALWLLGRSGGVLGLLLGAIGRLLVPLDASRALRQAIAESFRSLMDASLGYALDRSRTVSRPRVSGSQKALLESHKAQLESQRVQPESHKAPLEYQKLQMESPNSRIQSPMGAARVPEGAARVPKGTARVAGPGMTGPRILSLLIC